MLGCGGWEGLPLLPGGGREDRHLLGWGVGKGIPAEPSVLRR